MLIGTVFGSDHDVWVAQAIGRRVVALWHEGCLVPGHTSVDSLLALRPAALIAVDSRVHFGVRPIADLFRAIPSFAMLQLHPSRTVPDNAFRGLIAHRSRQPHANVLTLGGAYDPSVFAKRRTGEDVCVCVGRICPEKNQLPLAAGYRQRIWTRYRVPLLLAGGPDEHPDYFAEVMRCVDGEAVLHIDWQDAHGVAAILNRARFFVSPSRRETFGIALLEALACGTTAVVNGRYSGFDAGALRSRVFGSVTRSTEPVLDTLERALAEDVRIDASEWAKNYSVALWRDRILAFISSRLEPARTDASTPDRAARRPDTPRPPRGLST